jgi:hypothetical protein
MKNFFRNLFILIFRVKFVLVTIKDHNVTINKVPNTFYPGRDFLLKIEVPLTKLGDFKKNQFIRESVVLNYKGSDYIFPIISNLLSQTNFIILLIE